jgi:hypothetical protein
MSTSIPDPHPWWRTEAADAFVERVERWGTDTGLARAITQIADDTDEADAILEFITEYRRAAGH